MTVDVVPDTVKAAQHAVARTVRNLGAMPGPWTWDEAPSLGGVTFTASAHLHGMGYLGAGTDPAPGQAALIAGAALIRNLLEGE